MTYRVVLAPTAIDDLDALPRPLGQRILDKLQWYSERVDQLRPEPLQGHLKGLSKLRVGDYRIID